MGCRAPQTLHLSEIWTAQPASLWPWPWTMSGRRPRRSALCPPCGRPSNGRADVRCPRDRCPRDRCHPGVRTDRRPVSAAAASASAPCWILECVGAAGNPTFGASGSTCRCVRERLVVAAESGLMGEGWSCVGGARLRTTVCGRGGPPPRMRIGRGAAFAAWPTKGAGPAPRCRSVGWGAREGAGAHKSPRGMASWAGCRRDAQPWG
jgi:hypothetical protein